MRSFWADLFGPLGAALQAASQNVMVTLMAGFLGLTGGVLLLAAACVALVPLVGVAGALALTGLAFLLLATGAMLTLLTRRRIPAPPPPPDPMVQMIFDLSFNLGQSLRRRKH